MTIFGTSVKPNTGESASAALLRVTKMVNAQMVRVFLDRAEWSPKIQQVVDLGLKVAVSFKIWPATEEELVTFLRRLPAGSIVIYWHEPEDDIEAGKVKLTTITSRTTALANLIVKSGLKGKIRPATCLMAWSLQKASNRNWRAYYPESVVAALKAADGIIGWDAYAGKNAEGGPDRKVEDLFGGCALAAKEFGLPAAIFETGARSAAPMPSSVEEVHAAWWTKAIAFAKNPRRFGVDTNPFVCFLLWNSFNSVTGFDSRIDGLPLVVKVWKSANSADVYTKAEVDRLVAQAVDKTAEEHAAKISTLKTALDSAITALQAARTKL